MLLIISFSSLAVLAAPINLKPSALLAVAFLGLSAPEVSSFLPPQITTTPATRGTSRFLQSHSIWSDFEEWKDVTEHIRKDPATAKYLGSLSDSIPWMDPNKFVVEYSDGDGDETTLAKWLLRNERYLSMAVSIDGKSSQLLWFYLQGGERVKADWIVDVNEMSAAAKIKAFSFEFDVTADLLVAAEFREGRKDGDEEIDTIPVEWTMLSDEEIFIIRFKAAMLKRELIMVWGEQDQEGFD
jgi:hypothetical protein